MEAINPEEYRQLDEFFAYLREHVAENGTPEIGYFQPMSRAESNISAEREALFRKALTIEVAHPGWRRLWVARLPNGSIAGHIDLRAHTEHNAEHRCLLGMGVRSISRRNGVGSYLLENAKHWARSVGLEWIDLQVLSANNAAKSLYQRFGFATVGHVPEMFKIDGKYFSYTYMALRLSGEEA